MQGTERPGGSEGVVRLLNRQLSVARSKTVAPDAGPGYIQENIIGGPDVQSAIRLREWRVPLPCIGFNRQIRGPFLLCRSSVPCTLMSLGVALG